ncbi:recombinase RecT [Polynucleobacter sp. AP-Melu-500A-A1]|uniref:recombinase RecT n=1 Tax=Polynucleobacter sp. AP-Melu-500A-A1 TaxID=2576929 RepID=UPI001C0C1B65|nr:recombinase RecT [Polynucleobacter sp. AP-Melu-500A-A1]MBU3630094.1 recombinase RecT [Polynucleobacter sp. AP-Melu-500A-A1]
MRIKREQQKMGKRTFTLKELAQRNFNPALDSQSQKSELANGLNGQLCLSQIEEDLLDFTTKERSKALPDSAKPKDISKMRVNTEQSLALPIELISKLIQKEINKTAQTLELEEDELRAWLDMQVMTPKQTLLTLLRIAREHALDPLKEEVALALYDDCHWQAYITVEGYSKILNRHPAFNGIAFTESEENREGIPIWMECAIYRKDRVQPTVIREYFEEVKNDQTIWMKMPRRMLRHRVLQQCARLAVW